LVHSPNREGAWFDLNSQIWAGWSCKDVIPLK
jgi:hypothetical protein